jgi:magnesium transporter
MFRALYRTPDGQIRNDVKPEDLAALVEQPEGLLWADISCEPAEVCLPTLQDMFDFHPMALDDALVETHAPKVDDWGRYVYVLLHGVFFDDQADRPLGTTKLDLFVGANYVITHRDEGVGAVENVWTVCQRDEQVLKKGTAYLLYLLADELVAEYMPVIEQIDEAIDEIEDRVFENPDTALLEQLFRLKRALLRLRRTIAPQREVLNKLARGDFAVISTDDRIYFRDVYDHLVRLHDITESLRDLVGSVLDTYLSVVNNRMNDVMKALTVITTLFMPLSFMVGFFGMNFFQPVVSLPAWTDLPTFALTLGTMVAAPLAMLWWMRKRAWA